MGGYHCSHTSHHLVNGARAPREERAACWEPASLRSDWSGFRRLPGSRCLVGPAACRPYRQAVVGTGLRLSGVTSRGEWQQCRAGRRSPPVRSTVATPGPGYGGDGLHCSLTLSCLLNGGADFEGAMGRLLGAGLSGGRLLGVGPSWSRLPEHGRLLAVGHSASRPPEGGASS